MVADLLTYVPWVISMAAAAATVLPPGPPGSVLAVVHTFINFLAFNFGRAENRQHYEAEERDRFEREREHHDH